jgi:hypothetical protein
MGLYRVETQDSAGVNENEDGRAREEQRQAGLDNVRGLGVVD